jgi:hypothetical protein
MFCVFCVSRGHLIRDPAMYKLIRHKFYTDEKINKSIKWDADGVRRVLIGSLSAQVIHFPVGVKTC